MTSSPARIGPGTWREVGPFVAGFAKIAGRVQGTESPAVFLTLGRHRRLFWGWLHFAGRLMPGGRLSRRESELVIVRVASRRGSTYELTQHRRLARRAGLDAVEIADIEAGALDGSFSQRERLLLRATDELIATQDVDDELWAELGAVFDDRERIEILMLVGHYTMLATALHVLRVQPDRAVGGRQ